MLVISAIIHLVMGVWSLTNVFTPTSTPLSVSYSAIVSTGDSIRQQDELKISDNEDGVNKPFP